MKSFPWLTYGRITKDAVKRNVETAIEKEDKVSRRYNLDIVMVVPGMQIEWDILERKSLGGSETAGLYMAKELAKLGHEVVLFCNTTNPGKHPDKVVYLPLDQATAYMTLNPHDVLIVQRTPEAFAIRNPNKLNLLWCHDLALGRFADKFRAVLWNVDKVITVSDYMTSQYKEVYGVPDETFWTSRNGIDLDLVNKVQEYPKKSKQLVYAARPERGMDVLLEQVMPEIWKLDPDVTLKLCGYDNHVEHMAEFYHKMRQTAVMYGPKVEWLGALTKEELYRLYAESSLYVYPTPSPTNPEFAEVSCITAMECQAMGLPFVATDKGALKETLHPQAGVLIDKQPSEEGYVELFAKTVVNLLNDSAVRYDMGKAGRLHAQNNLGWDSLAKEWSDNIHEMIAERNDDPIRLAELFIRHSDIMAAKEILDTVGVGEVGFSKAKELKKRIDESWGFIESPEKFRTHYLEMGRITDERLSKTGFPDNTFDHSNERRFHLLEELLKSRPDIERILDYGCGHGWCDIYLERKVGRRWVGVDMDPGAIHWSKTFRDRFAKEPANMDFVQGGMEVELSGFQTFDMLLMSEVLEHCIDPVVTVEAMEKWVKPDGVVVLTVPYGPREYPVYNSIKHRNHIHELSIHDLREMFGKKPGVEIMGMYEEHIEELGEPAGFYFIRYRADHQPLGKINMERKLFLQRPPQTVSASMICGPGSEETLHWCLKSINSIVNEVVIADCGMSSEGIRICNQYPKVKLVAGKDPKVHGFDEARNMTLPYCTGDFILWIDSDEKMVNPQRIWKYLRDNVYHGYSIRQHHFAVDTSFKPDLPVRMFRNKPWSGKSLRFWGSIHEHPEAAVNLGPGPTIVLSDAHIAHVGYLVEEGRRHRFARNKPLLDMSDQKYPDRLLNKYFIMRDNILLCNYEGQSNGGQVTEGMRRMAQEVVDLYREHFLGKAGYLNGDALDYYSQACRILGAGAEVAFSIAADKEGVPQAEQRVARFASADDLKKDLMWRVEEQMNRFDNKWW